jgi:rhodanese-related sulfurtransferase
MFDSLRKWLGGSGTTPVPSHPTPPPEADEDHVDETVVPEVRIEELRARQSQENPFFVVDIREEYELQQVRLPANAGFTVLHISMNTIPTRLEELPRDQPLAVLCAHGSRSYGVTHYLVEQGFQASSVTGGITRWAIAGGEVEQGPLKIDD